MVLHGSRLVCFLLGLEDHLQLSPAYVAIVKGLELELDSTGASTGLETNNHP